MNDYTKRKAPSPPCVNCVAPKRHPGCHGSCDDYKEAIAEFHKMKEFLRKEAPFVEMSRRTHDRIMKRTNLKEK